MIWSGHILDRLFIKCKAHQANYLWTSKQAGPPWRWRRWNFVRLRFRFRSTRFPFLEDVNIGRHLEDWKLAQRLMYYWRWHDCAGGVGGVGESCWSVKGVGVWSEFSKHSGSGAPALTWARVTLNLLTRAYHTAWLLPTLYPTLKARIKWRLLHKLIYLAVSQIFYVVFSYLVENLFLFSHPKIE